MPFVVTGVSGRTGHATAEALLAGGHPVRVVVRDPSKGAAWASRGAEVAVADLTDAPGLTRAFRGAEGAYVLNPPDHRAPHYRAYQDRLSSTLETAITASGLPYVAFLSSIGAQHAFGTGQIAGLHAAEQLFGRIRGTVLFSIRAGFFYSNLIRSLPSVKGSGVLPTFIPAGMPLPMADAHDIGRLAAELLVSAPRQPQIVELGTAHSHDEIAAVFGRLLGRPVRAQEAPLEAVVPALTGAGFSQDVAECYREMFEGMRAGRVAFEGTHRRVESAKPLDAVLGRLLAG